MTTIRIGRTPEELEVELIPGDPLTYVMNQYDSPAGTPGRAPLAWAAAPTLEFPTAGVGPWAAIVVGNVATFAVTSADVDALIATGKHAAVLTVGGLVWARGAWTAV